MTNERRTPDGRTDNSGLDFSHFPFGLSYEILYLLLMIIELRSTIVTIKKSYCLLVIVNKSEKLLSLKEGCDQLYKLQTTNYYCLNVYFMVSWFVEFLTRVSKLGDHFAWKSRYQKKF